MVVSFRRKIRCVRLNRRQPTVGIEDLVPKERSISPSATAALSAGACSTALDDVWEQGKSATS
jgi:hypothetical protein